MKKVIINCLFFLITIISFSACSNFIEDIANTEQKLQPSDCTVAYTVEHYLQSEDRASFNIVTSDTIQLQGKPESLTQAVANTYKGFSPQEIEQLPIKSDGSTIIKIYYYRLDSIIYDLAGGTNSSDNPDYYYDDNLPIQLKAPTKDGFIFFAWITEEQDIVSEIKTASVKPIKLKALWYKEGEAYYLVKHNLQELEDLNKYTFKEKEYLVGNANAQTSLSGKNYTGFTNQTITQQVINNDHSTVVNINYDRNTYTVHFVVSYDDRKDYSEFELSGLYQQKIQIPDSQINSEYFIEKLEPGKCELFEEDTKYHISLKSKYVYSTTNENATITLPFICRDFRDYTETGTGDGFISDEHITQFGSSYIKGHGHPDFEHANYREQEIVKPYLDTDGLPVFNKSQAITEGSFYTWYRDIPGINQKFCKTLVLTRVTSTSNDYEYRNSAFFPIDNEGYGNNYSRHNYGFTDEMCFYFQYNGNEIITINGDDDIWVFVNGILAIDLGGCHSADTKTISLSSINKTMIIDETPVTYKYNSEFDISEGQFVEVKIFHAERHTTSSHLNLTLKGMNIFCNKSLR